MKLSSSPSSASESDYSHSSDEKDHRTDQSAKVKKPNSLPAQKPKTKPPTQSQTSLKKDSKPSTKGPDNFLKDENMVNEITKHRSTIFNNFDELTHTILPLVNVKGSEFKY